MRHYLGIDLGGTQIKAGIVDEAGKPLGETEAVDTPFRDGVDAVIDEMYRAAERVCAANGVAMGDIAGVGAGTPGPVDGAGEVVLVAPNLHWKNVPLRRLLAERFEPEVVVVNDANAAAFGEYLSGAGADVEGEEAVTHLILLTLGTGVGGGVVSNRKLHIGPHGAGAELGHTIIQFNGTPCACGSSGCLERYASATAVVNIATDLIRTGADTQLPETPTAKDVFDCAKGGDRVAKQVVKIVCTHLGAACVNFVRSFDPQMIVLGGGLSAAGATLLDGVREAYETQNWHAAPNYTRIELATLGNNAGFIGAAGLAMDKLRGE